jgi:N-acetylmuramate 1-kinase
MGGAAASATAAITRANNAAEGRAPGWCNGLRRWIRERKKPGAESGIDLTVPRRPCGSISLEQPRIMMGTGELCCNERFRNPYETTPQCLQAPLRLQDLMSRVCADDSRRTALMAWLQSIASTFGLHPDTLRPASSDASFRRYFRLDADGAGTLIAMDAPPDRYDSRPFVEIARLFAAAGVTTPQILAEDLTQGLLLLSDLGPTTYLEALEAGADAQPLYLDALDSLVRIQAATRAGVLPPYDHDRLLTELRLFPDWYIVRHLQASLEPSERAALDRVFELLIGSALTQPGVYVHRDYHSRNLMRLAGGNPGVLDFQDAVQGPAGYDLVSLLRDAYVEWPEEQQIEWAVRYWERARAAGVPVPGDFAELWRSMEWIGLQRSLKVLGIFARLYYRDGKDRYLADLPLVMRHTRRVVERYAAFDELRRLLDRLDTLA